MTARVSMLLKSRATLACFRACFLPGWDKDLSAPRYLFKIHFNIILSSMFNCLKCFFFVSPLKAHRSRDAPTGLTSNNCTLCPHCIYVFCVSLTTNSDLCRLQHKLIGFYNRDEKCLLRGTNWVFTYNPTLCPHCIYVLCIYLRTNSDLCHLQHKLISFYNRD